MQTELPIPQPSMPRERGPSRAAHACHRTLFVGDACFGVAGLEFLDRRFRCSVDRVVTVEAALERLTHCTPCVVVVDAGAVGIVGGHILDHLRRHPAAASLAIVLVARDADESMLDAAHGFGALDFVRKPVDESELLLRVASQLRCHEARVVSQVTSKQLLAIAHATQDAVVILDEFSRVIFWNDSATRMFGIREGDCHGQDFHRLIAPSRYLEAAQRAFERFRSTGEGDAIGRTNELIARHASGAEFPIELSLSSTKIDDRWHAVGIVRDISERKRNEQILAESERLQRTLLEHLTTGVVIIDAVTRRIERANQAAEELLSIGSDSLCGGMCHDRICQSGRDSCATLELLRAVTCREEVLIRADGSRVPILKSIVPIELDGKVKILETFVDLTEQKRKDGLYRSIFDHSFDAILTIDTEARGFSSANPACLQLFGVTSEQEFLSFPPEVYSPLNQPDGTRSCDSYWRHLELTLRDGHRTFEWTHLKRGGITFEANVQFIRMRQDASTQVQVIIRDVSEQRHAERQLEVERQNRERAEVEARAAQKLEAIGQLAAGIAHELNTPTQFVSDSVHFLQEALLAQQSLVDRCRELKEQSLTGVPLEILAKEFELAETKLDLDYLREQGPAAARSAIEGLARIASIVRAMKDFSHPDTSEKTLADLNCALRDTLTIARNEYKYVATVVTHFGELPMVECHLGALNQVFLNLIVNAAHAVSDRVEKTGELGQITVRTVDEGSGVRIEVSDTGTGIPEHVRKRIFEPFFTTKEVGRGTGQGLAMARSVVCGRHGGTIEFESVTDVGTTFTIRIPRKGCGA